MREEYSPPVGFASEPAERRRATLTRIFTILLLGLIAYITVTKVINVQDEQGGSVNVPQITRSQLPGGG